MLKVLHYPNPKLREKADLVTAFDSTLANQVTTLFSLMHEEQGIGLAATQVGLNQRFFVMDISGNQSEPLCLINPEILNQKGEARSKEGCLSVPGLYAFVKRAAYIQVRYQDETGHEHHLEAHDLKAYCIQHEIDHLNGILFIDHLSKLKRSLYLQRLKKHLA